MSRSRLHHLDEQDERQQDDIWPEHGFDLRSQAARHGNAAMQEAMRRSTVSGAGGGFPFQSEMEGLFGRDFSGLRVETGVPLGGLDAEAVAAPGHLRFADHAPSRELVAHELAHAAQYLEHGGGAAGEASLSEPEDGAEQEADQIAAQVARGQAVRPRARPQAGLHRKKRSRKKKAAPADNPWKKDENKAPAEGNNGKVDYNRVDGWFKIKESGATFHYFQFTGDPETQTSTATDRAGAALPKGALVQFNHGTYQKINGHGYAQVFRYKMDEETDVKHSHGLVRLSDVDLNTPYDATGPNTEAGESDARVIKDPKRKKRAKSALKDKKLGPAKNRGKAKDYTIRFTIDPDKVEVPTSNGRPLFTSNSQEDDSSNKAGFYYARKEEGMADKWEKGVGLFQTLPGEDGRDNRERAGIGRQFLCKGQEFWAKEGSKRVTRRLYTEAKDDSKTVKGGRSKKTLEFLYGTADFNVWGWVNAALLQESPLESSEEGTS